MNAVTKPDRTQLGGDAFMLVWRKRTGEVDCLNAGGRAPLQASLDLFPDGIRPRRPGEHGAGAGRLVARDAQALRDAIARRAAAAALELAEGGFPVSTHLSGLMGSLVESTAPEEEALRRAFLVDGRRPYAPGETLRQPELAAVLGRIVQDEREGFYGGETAQLIAQGMAAFGGLIDEADFEKPTAHWHEPLVTTFNGCEVYEQALPSQGIILLEALNIVENFPMAEWGLTSPDAAHVMIEATKLAIADVRRYAADPDVESVPAEVLISKEHAGQRAKEIDLGQAKQHGPAPLASDTTQFVVADEDTVVTYIQSVFAPWGSRFVVPGTGILMNNRLRGFDTDATSPNRLEPGKRTVHTLNTFLALLDGRLALGGGTPGGAVQVQTNLQTIVGSLCWGLDVQTAIDAPRWSLSGEEIAMERRFPEAVREGLATRGHVVRTTGAWAANCRSQMVTELAEGGWAAASDLRGEGVALAV